jgi:hypothetical protein
MALQETPTRPVTVFTLMSKRPRREVMEGESAGPTSWQHSRVPVLHWLEGEPDPPVAAARVATATIVRVASLKCMLEIEELEQMRRLLRLNG